MNSSPTKPLLVIVGQTPPPWHGQAVATQMLFKADWSDCEVRCIRMAFSNEMEEIGHFRLGKLFHIFHLLRSIREAVGKRKDGILLYPPASPNWVPVLRDLIILPIIRRHFRKIIYIYHAGGVGAWMEQSQLRRKIANLAYGRADLSLEVAREKPSPHETLGARHWAWVPYGVEVPRLPKARTRSGGPTTVLFVGSLQEGKGVLEVLKTAKLLKDAGKGEHYRFRLVGRWFSDSFEKHALALVNETKIGEMVEFPGQLTGDDKWSIYHQSDIFFFPTQLADGFTQQLPASSNKWTHQFIFFCPRRFADK